MDKNLVDVYVEEVLDHDEVDSAPSDPTPLFITHHDDPTLIHQSAGSHYIGYIKVDYKTLVDTLGKPIMSIEEAIDAQWYVQLRDGSIFHIYNWKNGPKWSKENKFDDIQKWIIGSKSSKGIDSLELIFPGNEIVIGNLRQYFMSG